MPWRPDTEWTAYYQRMQRIQQKVQFPFEKQNSPQIMTPPWPLLLILSVPQRERGTKDIQHETSEPHQGLSVHWGSSYITLKYPLTCPVASQSASEVRNMAASGDRIPRVHSDQGGREVPAPVLNRTHSPEGAAGCVTVGNSHRTPRTRWFLHKTLYTSLPTGKQTQKTSSKYNLSHNIKETNPFMLMPWEVYRLCTNKINPHKFWNSWWIHTWSQKKLIYI